MLSDYRYYGNLRSIYTFYLETKDGDRFFTDPTSNDKLEFEKIIESKLGQSSAELFDTLISEAKGINDDLLEQLAVKLESCISTLDSILSSEEIDKIKLEDILISLQSIYNSMD